MKNQKGITLIALIITIIVMLILVAVSVTVALQSGLFSAAGNAASDMQEARENEILTSEGQVTVGETKYNSMQEYIDSLKGGTGSGTTGGTEEDLIDPDGDGITTFTLYSKEYEVEAGTTWGDFVTALNQVTLESPVKNGCGLEGCSWFVSLYLFIDPSGDVFSCEPYCECGNRSVDEYDEEFYFKEYFTICYSYNAGGDHGWLDHFVSASDVIESREYRGAI